jgi:hypothetical protein
VQFVDLALPFLMLQLPHPLLADRVDLDGVVRRLAGGEVNARAPGEHHHGDAERNHAPQNFQRVAGVLDVRQFVLRTAAVLDGEIEDGPEDQQREEHGDREHEIQQVIHLGSQRGGLYRK